MSGPTSALRFPRLAVLDALCERLRPAVKPALHNVVFVCVQHLLETTGSLFESLIGLGADPRRIHVLGKHYSTNDSVAGDLRSLGCHVYHGSARHGPGQFAAAFQRDVARMWAAAERSVEQTQARVVVVDDGGRCLAATPPGLRKAGRVVGIEQTTSGLSTLVAAARGELPVVRVATSAAKRRLESPLISDAVLERVGNLLSCAPTTMTCGVVGLGNVGRALARDVRSRGFRVVSFDLRSGDVLEGVTRVDSLAALFREADIIFGCSGSDTMERAEEWLPAIIGQKVLASCSSEDKEFRSLLTSSEGGHDHQAGPLADVRIPLVHATVTVLRGGFPINFDGSRESVPARDIQLTRGLLLGGIAQALLCNPESTATPRVAECLEPAVQRFVVRTWLKGYSGGRDLCADTSLKNFGDDEWVRVNSDGELPHCPRLRHLLEPTA